MKNALAVAIAFSAAQIDQKIPNTIALPMSTDAIMHSMGSITSVAAVPTTVLNPMDWRDNGR